MKLCQAIVCMMCCLASVCMAQQQNLGNLNWNTTGAGARAEGFGGAFIGVADDATAIVWNPGGLGQLERAEISVVGRYVMESSDEKDPINGVTVSNTWSHPNFNFASIAVPFSAGSVNIVPAVAYQSQLDLYFKYGNDSINATGGVGTVTPGIGLRFGSVFSLGAATNFWLGTADYTEKMQSGTLKDGFTFKGLNFVAGALFDFGGLSRPVPLKLGAVVKSPFTLKFDQDLSFTAPSVTVTGKGSYEVEMPLMAGFGASYQIGESFTLAADYEMRMYSDKKVKQALSVQGFDTTWTNPLSDHNKDLNQFRVGAEYLFVMNSGVIPIRAGFRTVPSLMSNYAWDQANSRFNADEVSGVGFSGGTGFISNSFALDFAFSHDQYEQKISVGGQTAYSYSYAVNRVSGSLIVYF